MADKLSTVLTIAIILIAGFYVYESFYKPQEIGGGESEENLTPLSTQANQSEFISLANSWQIPKTNVTYTHNVSIANNSRIEFFTFRNFGRSKNTTLLMVVPKSVASSAEKVQFSHEPIVLRNDPAFLITLSTASGSTVDLAIVITPAASRAPIFTILLPSDFDPVIASRLLTVFETHQRFFDSLALARGQNGQTSVEDAAQELSTFLADVGYSEGVEEQVDSLLSSMERRESMPPLEIQVQNPQPIKISGAVPFGFTTFEIPFCLSSNAQGCPANYPGPLMRFEEYPGITTIYSSGEQAGGRQVVRVDIDANAIAPELIEMEESWLDGSQVAQFNAIISYPEEPGRAVAIPIKVELAQDYGISSDEKHAEGTLTQGTQTTTYPLYSSILKPPIPGALVVAHFGLVGGVRLVRGNFEPHSGTDYGARQGTPIYAPADGKISKIRRNCRNVRQCLCGNGVHLISRLNLPTGVEKYRFKMCHMTSVEVVEGQEVKQGDLVGTVGATGKTDGPHLHIEAWSYQTKENTDFEQLLRAYGEQPVEVVASNG